MFHDTLRCPFCGRRAALPAALAPGLRLHVRCRHCRGVFQLRLANGGPEPPLPASPKTHSGIKPVALDADPSFGGIVPGEAVAQDGNRTLARSIAQGLRLSSAERREPALAAGTLLLEFGDDIRRAWERFMAEATGDPAVLRNLFNEAINEFLADGRPLL